MALEPLIATADTGPIAELVDMTRRFWIGLALSRAGVALEMGGHLPALQSPDRPDSFELDPARARHAGRAVGGLAVLRARLALDRHAQSQHVHADRHGHRRRLALQRGRDACARASSRRPSAASTARSPVYFEAAAVITVLVLLGQVLELRARQTTSGAIRALLDLAPKTARRICDDGSERGGPSRQSQVGDRLRVRPGEKRAGRRHRDRGASHGRRVDGHRRIDAGQQGDRRPASSAER